jgi:hypothetical protein
MPLPKRHGTIHSTESSSSIWIMTQFSDMICFSILFGFCIFSSYRVIPDSFFDIILRFEFFYFLSLEVFFLIIICLNPISLIKIESVAGILGDHFIFFLYFYYPY